LTDNFCARALLGFAQNCIVLFLVGLKNFWVLHYLQSKMRIFFGGVGGVKN